MLSGFVLTWSSADPVAARPFYRRRFARIYPLHLVTWAAAVGSSILVGDQKPLFSIVLSLLLLQAWAPVTEYYFGGNSPSWSLSCEAFFYTVFPFLAYRGPRLAERAGWLLPAVGVVTIGGILYALTPVYSHWLAYISPMYRIGEFLVGILLASAVRQGLRLWVPFRVALLALCCSYAVVALAFQDLGNGFRNAFMLPSIVLVLAAAAVSDLRGQRTLWSSNAMVKFGEWSFALYLIHYSAARLLERILGEPLRDNPVVGPALVLVFLAAMTLASCVTYRVIERPFERRLRGASEVAGGSGASLWPRGRRR